MPQHLSIYVVEDLQKQLRGCAQEISIYQTKLSKLEAQLAKYNREFNNINEIQAAVPEADLDLQDRITLLKRQFTETYTSLYYSILERKLALNWKEAEYKTLAMEIKMVNIHRVA